jgi:hypothetical protein
MLTGQTNRFITRHPWFVAALVLPLLALYTLLNLTARPAHTAAPAAPQVGNGRAPDAGGIIVTPTTGLTTTEAGGVVTFTVVLTDNPTASVMITLTTSDASEGVVSPLVLTFTQANWDEPQTATVTGVDDFVDDGDVAYTIITEPAVSNDPDYNGLNAADVAVVNADNDTAGILVAPTSGLLTSEGGLTDTFTIVLTSQPTANVTLNLSSSDPGEGTVAPPSVTFTPADWDDPQTVTVTGVNDDIDDGNQPYTIITAAASSSDPNYNNLNPADVSVTNQDDDTAAILVEPTAGLVTSENGNEDTFTIALATQPTANVTIALNSSDTSEGTVAPPSVTFTPADWDDPQTVTVTGVDDDVDDGNQPYTIVTGAASSSDPSYNGLNPADVSVTNQDDDTAAIVVDPIAGLVTGENGNDDTFTIALATQPTADVTIALNSSDTSEGTIDPASVTFTPANWDDPQTVTVTGVDDAADDGDQPYQIVTAPADSSDPAYDGLNPADVSATNVDNDGVGISIDPLSDLVTTEAGGSDTFTVQLDTEPTADVTIAFSSSDPSEGTVDPTSLTFTPANWDDPQTVTVTGVDDELADGDVLYSIITAPAESDDPAYDGLNPADVSVTNQDDEQAAILVNPTSGLVTSEDGGSDTFAVRLNSQPTGNVVILLNSSDTTEGTISPNSLIFTPQNWDTWQEVTVTGVDDDLTDGDIAYTIITSPATSSDSNYDGLNPADVQVINKDRDSRLFLPAIVVVPTPPPTWQQIGDQPAEIARFLTVDVCGLHSFAGADTGLYRLVGNSWQSQTGAGFPALPVSGIAFTADCSAVYVGSRGQGTWRGTLSGGNWNWQRVDTESQTGDNTVWSLLIRGNTVYAGTDGGLFWANLPSTPQSWNQTNITGWVTGLTLNEDGTIYAAVWNQGVFQAASGSNTFTVVGTIGNTLVYQAAKTSNDYHVAGTQTQIYHWLNGNWQPVNQFVSTTFAVAAANGRLYAGQRNNGVLVSTNGGQSWATMNDGIAMPGGEEFQVRGFFIDNSGYLYAATTSGVWRWSAPVN